MKYCTHCGTQLIDEAVYCANCGRSTEPTSATTNNSTLKTVAKAFMLVSCILTGFYLIPLCWTIPMTVYYWKAVGQNKPVGTGFKVCSLLFVSTVAGIIMLCDKDN